MHLTAQVRYDADVDRVAAVLSDPAFVDAKVRASGATAQQADVVGTPDGPFTVTTRRQVPTTGIPPQFRHFVGSTLEVRQVEAWEAPGPDGRRGTVVVEITGAPVRVTGTMRLEADPRGGSVQHLDGEIKASVPLFASTVEEAAAGAVRDALVAEERTAAAWLRR